jgi:hypothetical protein
MKLKSSLTRLLTAMVIMASLFMVSCKKESSSTGTPAEQQEFAAATSESDAENEAVFDDVFDNVMGVNNEVAIGGTGVFGSANTNIGSGEAINGANRLDTNTCFTVAFLQLSPPNRFPLQVTIDFGAGCTDRRGITRKGKIIITYSGPLFIPGNSATTTFEGYYVNGIHVEGTHKVTNQSTQDKKVFKILVIGAKLTKPNGNFSQWNSEKVLAQVEGLGTPFFPLDDVYTISGGASGAVKRGDKFFQWATIIKEPLVKKFTCRYIVKGIIVLRKSDQPVAELDYGTGQCDNKALLTVNGTTVEITLH